MYWILLDPLNNAESSVAVFRKSRAAFHPVAGIAVKEVAHGLDRRVVDVATDQTVYILVADFPDEYFLKIPHVVDRRLAFVFEPGGDGEIVLAPEMTILVVPAVDDQKAVVENGTDIGQPLAVLDDAVELVAVHYQIFLSVDSDMDNLIADMDTVQRGADVLADDVVVIAREKVDLRAVFRFFEDKVDDTVVDFRPEPVLSEFPEVENIAYQIEMIGFGFLEKRVELVALEVSAAEVGIRYPETPEVQLLHVYLLPEVTDNATSIPIKELWIQEE